MNKCFAIHTLNAPDFSINAPKKAMPNPLDALFFYRICPLIIPPRLSQALVERAFCSYFNQPAYV